MSGDQTPAVPTVVAALAAVMGEARAVAKDQRNAQQGFNFRGIDQVMAVAGPAFRKHGVMVMPVLVSLERGTQPTAKGGTMNTVAVVVDYVFYGPAGDTITCRVPGESFDSGDKATAKAMSVAMRTALLQALALPTDDVDPDAVSYERGPAGAQRGAQDRQEAPQPDTMARAAWRGLGEAGRAHVQGGWPEGVPTPAVLADERFGEVAELFAQGADLDSQGG